MPRSATTGVYARVVNSFSQPVFGTLIDPTDADAYFDDLDVGLNPANLAGPTNIIGALTLGKAGTTVGTLGFFNATTGSITLSPPTGALGSAVLTLPDATDTLVGLGTTDTFTGAKTFGVAGNVGKLVVAGNTSGVTILNATAIASGTLTLPAATDTLVGKATTDELTNKTLTSSVGKGTWTASGTWTLPAYTLNGTVSGGGNQINNVIIGTVTPLAGSFTTIGASGTISSTATGGLSISAANPRVTLADTGTSFSFADINGGGQTGLRFGQEGSSGGSNLIVGSAAGDGVINMRDAKRILFGTNNTAVAYLYSSGAFAVAATPVDVGANNLYVQGGISSGIPVSSASTTRTIGNAEGSSIFTAAGTVTATLPAAASFPGRWWHAKTTTAQLVNSATSNVVPKVGGAAAAAILPATIGAWAVLQSDGSNWVIMLSGT